VALLLIVLSLLLSPSYQTVRIEAWTGPPTVMTTATAAPRKVAVPRTVGRLLPDARARLHRAGLRARVIRVRSLQPIATVVSSRPVAGRRVARGSRVRIAVSRGPGP